MEGTKRGSLSRRGGDIGTVILPVLCEEMTHFIIRIIRRMRGGLMAERCAFERGHEITGHPGASLYRSSCSTPRPFTSSSSDRTR